MESNKPKVIIAGGGTGGHVFPALAIAKALRKLYPDIGILFLGAKGKMEMEKIPAEGFTIIGLPIAGLQRHNFKKNILLPFKILSSLFKAARILFSYKPGLVVGVGGYASVPVVFMAQRLRIPVLIQEQNSYPGMTNRKFGARSAKICVAYDGMEKYFKKEKILLTGNPVRPEITTIPFSKKEARQYFGFDMSRPVVLAVGGSLGAYSLNSGMSHFLGEISDNSVQVLWQTGKSYIQTAENIIAEQKIKSCKAFQFIGRMDMAYAAADIVVSRAGAIAISELCVIGKPVILIPSPNVTDDHQRKNALALVGKNAAILLEDAQAKENLGSEILNLLRNLNRQKELSDNISKLGISNADEIIAREILKLMKLA